MVENEKNWLNFPPKFNFPFINNKEPDPKKT